MIILSAPIFYMLSWVWHEFCHCLEYFRQGSTECKIDVYKSTMRVTGNYDDNHTAVAYAGGIYSGITFLGLGLFAMYTPTLWDTWLEYFGITLGAMQIFYGIFEGNFLEKWYGNWKYNLRYLIYIGTILGGTILYWNKLIEFINL